MMRAIMPAFLKRPSRTRGKRKKRLRCRPLIGHHLWNCDNVRDCQGLHRCQLCSAVPA